MDKELGDEPGGEDLLKKVEKKCIAVFGDGSQPYGWVAESKVE